MLEGVTLLLVDDERDQLDMYTYALVGYGARVRTATNVREAVEVLERAPVDVAVCDLTLGGEGGLDFVRALREIDARRGRRTAAVALTGWTDNDVHERVLAAGGFDEYHAKPCLPDELVTTIARLTGRASKSDTAAGA
jgi:CheY-like chemotaxis protein